jgi:hypothetical protein
MISPGRTTIAGGLLFDGVSPLLAEATIVVEGDNIVSITGPSAAEPGPAGSLITTTRRDHAISCHARQHPSGSLTVSRQ